MLLRGGRRLGKGAVARPDEALRPSPPRRTGRAALRGAEGQRLPAAPLAVLLVAPRGRSPRLQPNGRALMSTLSVTGICSTLYAGWAASQRCCE